MIYQFQNISLLKDLYDLLLAFPFTVSDEKRINSMDLAEIHKAYTPYSDMENDPVANAICWSASTVQSLVDKRPVRAMDEVVSFVESTLKKQGNTKVSMFT